MDDIYKYLLKNSTLNDLIEACLENKNIAIIISNNEIEDVLIYLKNYILNNITTEELKKRVNAVSINHTIDMVKIKKFNILNREISNNKKKIMEIFLSFIKKDNEGKSLNDLYSITKKSLEFKDKEFKYFCVLNKFKLFTDNNKEAIIENIQKLFEGEYINLFIKYKKFNGNKKFNIINKELTNEDIVKVKLKMSGILNNTFAFIPPIYYNKYTSDFERENIYYKNYNENQLLEVVKRINYKHNKKMLDKITDIKWYKLNDILNHKRILNENKEINNEYLRQQEIIYKQYIENIENLALFSNSFGFIKKVFKNEVLDEINNRITNEEDLYNYISYLKETLSSYEEYLVVASKIEMLNDIQSDILNYCYDKIDNKKDLGEIIQFIPNYFLYKEIEIDEIENEIEINNYESIDNKINNIYLALSSYKNIALQVLQEYSNKTTNDFIKENSIDIFSLNYKEIVDNKYKKENYKFLSKLYPITVIYEEEFKDNKKVIEKNFDIVIKSSDFFIYNGIDQYKSEVLCNERLDKKITTLLSNLGYRIFENENNNSVLYVLGCKCQGSIKTLYINNGESFSINNLIELLNLIDKNGKIIYIWYRNWWLNKAEEIDSLQKQLNK
ncbi:hypothetical protein [uncultured Clostridium sp.]|uniref:hypothetical protein n=1 Tax=uncultured Clostridium sp. TaxID=59620 RepID=UPI0025F3C368|nr:hypothetical protein [uncultured Clostridium sp.]